MEEREILKGLKDDMSIIICPADKGKAVVVEDRDAYMVINLTDNGSSREILFVDLY